MNNPELNARFKSWIISALGEGPAALIHGARFWYLINFRPKLDREVKHLSRFLRDGDVAIDVGANGADWTYCLSRAVGKTGMVFAFEADPYYAKATGHAIKFMRLNNATLFPFGLSDKHETALLQIMDGKGNRLSGLGAIDRTATNEDQCQRVDLRTLDSVSASYPKIQHCALIKIDVEGFELFVLRGATGVIEKSRPIVILEVGRYDEQGYSSKDISVFFRARNYSAFCLSLGDEFLLADSNLHHKDATGVNRIMVPNEKSGLFITSRRPTESVAKRWIG